MTNTRTLIGSAAFVVALTGGGIAGALIGTPGTSGAQEATTTSEDGDVTTVHAAHRPAHLDAAADALGMTAEELEAQLEAGKTIAEVATAEGVDIEAVIDALVADATGHIREHVTALVNGEVPLRAAHHRFAVKLDAVATALGITRDELRAAHESGQSIAEIAAAEGVDVQAVIDALVESGVPADRAEELVEREGGFRPHRGGRRP